MDARKSTLRTIACAAAVLLITPTARAAITDNLILHTTLDSADISGTTVSDVAAPAQNGTIGNPTNVASVTGKMGDALSFTPVTPTTLNQSGKVTFADDSALDPGTGAFTVSVWAKLDVETGLQSLVNHSNNNGSNVPGWQIYYRNNVTDGLQFQVRTCGPTTSDRIGTKSPALTAGTIAGNWFNVVMVIDRTATTTTIRGYLNGSNTGWTAGAAGPTLDTLANPTINIDSTETMKFGVQKDSTVGNEIQPLDGTLDDIAIWNRALNAAEVQDIYTRGLQGFNVTQVPEPSACAVIAGLSMMTTLRRRRETM